MASTRKRPVVVLPAVALLGGVVWLHSAVLSAQERPSWGRLDDRDSGVFQDFGRQLHGIVGARGRVMLLAPSTAGTLDPTMLSRMWLGLTEAAWAMGLEVVEPPSPKPPADPKAGPAPENPRVLISTLKLDAVVRTEIRLGSRGTLIAGEVYTAPAPAQPRRLVVFPGSAPDHVEESLRVSDDIELQEHARVEFAAHACAAGQVASLGQQVLAVFGARRFAWFEWREGTLLLGGEAEIPVGTPASSALRDPVATAIFHRGRFLLRHSSTGELLAWRPQASSDARLGWSVATSRRREQALFPFVDGADLGAGLYGAMLAPGRNVFEELRPMRAGPRSQQPLLRNFVSMDWGIDGTPFIVTRDGRLVMRAAQRRLVELATDVGRAFIARDLAGDGRERLLITTNAPPGEPDRLYLMRRRDARLVEQWRSPTFPGSVVSLAPADSSRRPLPVAVCELREDPDPIPKRPRIQTVIWLLEPRRLNPELGPAGDGTQLPVIVAPDEIPAALMPTPPADPLP